MDSTSRASASATGDGQVVSVSRAQPTARILRALDTGSASMDSASVPPGLLDQTAAQVGSLRLCRSELWVHWGLVFTVNREAGVQIHIRAEICIP